GSFGLGNIALLQIFEHLPHIALFEFVELGVLDDRRQVNVALIEHEGERKQRAAGVQRLDVDRADIARDASGDRGHRKPDALRKAPLPFHIRDIMKTPDLATRWPGRAGLAALTRSKV